MNVLIEVSGEQTKELGEISVRELGLSWIIIQYEIKVHRVPNAMENITIKTFTKEHNRLFSYREFEVYDEKGVLIVYVMTVFALINGDRKLTKIPAEIVKGYGSTENRRIKRMPKPELPENKNEAMKRDYSVGYFDIDTNFHANNSMYFMWMLEALEDEFLSEHTLTYGNVVFEKEGHIDEHIESYADLAKNDEGELISRHQIDVEGVSKCIGTFTWQENEEHTTIVF